MSHCGTTMVWIGCWAGGLEYKIFEEPKMNRLIYIETLKWFHERLTQRGLPQEWLDSYLLQQDNSRPHIEKLSNFWMGLAY